MNKKMSREEMRRVLDLEPTEIADADLCSLLLDRFEADPVPPCRVCGGALSIASIGGGHATLYACSEWEDDPDKPGHLRRKADRGMADDHYAESQWTQYKGGDSLVLELVRRFQAGQEGATAST